MENEANGSSVITWKYGLAVAGTVIVLLIGLVSTLTMAGVNSIQSHMREVTIEFKKRCEDDDRRHREADKEQHVLKTELTEVKILLTMNHNERMQALERLQKIKGQR